MGLALVGVGIVIVFAYLEVLYIYIQDHVIARCKLVEGLLNVAARGQVASREGHYRFGISQALEGRYPLRGLATALVGRPTSTCSTSRLWAYAGAAVVVAAAR
jgi:hypothetical protein